MSKPLADEVEHVAQAILTKVFQGNEAKIALCKHIAEVAVDAHHEWGDDRDWRAALDAQLPHGLCGNREDHQPHVFTGSLGRIHCHADQTKRLPYAAELRRTKVQ